MKNRQEIISFFMSLILVFGLIFLFQNCSQQNGEISFGSETDPLGNGGTFNPGNGQGTLCAGKIGVGIPPSAAYDTGSRTLFICNVNQNSPGNNSVRVLVCAGGTGVTNCINNNPPPTDQECGSGTPGWVPVECQNTWTSYDMGNQLYKINNVGCTNNLAQQGSVAYFNIKANGIVISSLPITMVYCGF